MTLYSTPMGYVIPMLAGVMGAQGFALTAPVFEHLATPDILQHELALDITNGLVGKTAIHPSQVNIIQNALRVSLEDMNSARMILNSVAPQCSSTTTRCVNRLPTTNGQPTSWSAPNGMECYPHPLRSWMPAFDSLRQLAR